MVFDGIGSLEEVITNSVNQWSNNLEAMTHLLGYKWIREQCSEVY